MDILLSIAIFLLFGFGFVLLNLVVGAFVRPDAPNPEKKSIYECGEPTIGSSWVQFDLRFYVVALFFLIFDVEVALLWPIAVVFRQHAGPALAIVGVFMGLILIGYVYEWYSGSLDWIRSTANVPDAPGRAPATGRSTALHDMARRDPEMIEEEKAHHAAASSTT